MTAKVSTILPILKVSRNAGYDFTQHCISKIVMLVARTKPTVSSKSTFIKQIYFKPSASISFMTKKGNDTLKCYNSDNFKCNM